MELNDTVRCRVPDPFQAILGDKEDLHQTRRYLECILQHSSDMIFASDSNGILVSFSSGSEKALGYSSKEVIGKAIRELAVDPTGFDQLAAACREEGSTSRSDVVFRHKDGRTIFCDVSLTALTNPQGEIIGIVGVAQDTTRWKQFQEDLIRVDRLAEIGRNAAGITHEINNPIAVIGEIGGWIGAVAADAKGLNTEDREEIETAVQHIEQQIKRCKSMTRQLLSFVRDSGPSTASVDVHKLLEETVAFLKPELKYKDIEVAFQLMNGAPAIETDQQKVEQVLVNLVSNAIYAVKEKAQKGGRIEIATIRDGSMMEIRISDNGTGISEENQKRMYDLFYTTKPPGKGTGLGLPICLNIIQKLGGHLTFKTEPGEGTTFFVRLPVS